MIFVIQSAIGWYLKTCFEHNRLKSCEILGVPLIMAIRSSMWLFRREKLFILYHLGMEEEP